MVVATTTGPMTLVKICTDMVQTTEPSFGPYPCKFWLGSLDLLSLPPPFISKPRKNTTQNLIRAQTTCLVSIFVIPVFPVAYFITRTIYAIKILVSIREKQWKHGNYSPRGPFSSSLFSLSISYIPPLKTICASAIKHKLVFLKKRRKHKIYSTRAQMTRLASFGPVFIVTAFLVAYFTFRTYIFIQTLVSIKNTKKNYNGLLT